MILNSPESTRHSDLVIDATIALDEVELVEFRTRYLAETVDFFVIAESPTTFSGQPKPLHISELSSRGELPDQVCVEVIEIPKNLFQREIFDVEFFVRHELTKRVSNRFPGAKILVNDVDEIPSREQVSFVRNNFAHSQVASIPMRIYFRKANWELAVRRKRLWTPPKVFSGEIPAFNIRSLPTKERIKGELGAHLSFLNMNGPRQEFKFKNYGHREYDRPGLYTQEFLDYCDYYGLDHLGRGNREGLGLLIYHRPESLPSVCQEFIEAHPPSLGGKFSGNRFSRILRAQFVCAYVLGFNWPSARNRRPWDISVRAIPSALALLIKTLMTLSVTSTIRAIRRARRILRRKVIGDFAGNGSTTKR